MGSPKLTENTDDQACIWQAVPSQVNACTTHGLLSFSYCYGYPFLLTSRSPAAFSSREDAGYF